MKGYIVICFLARTLLELDEDKKIAWKGCHEGFEYTEGFECALNSNSLSQVNRASVIPRLIYMVKKAIRKMKY